jgi:D-tyrosyl-tRNA(Tyr) deacylase
MRAVVQRVTRASVSADGEPSGEIGTGLVVLLGITHDDTAEKAQRMAAKLHTLRILRDEQSVADTGGGAGPRAANGTGGGAGPRAANGTGGGAGPRAANGTAAGMLVVSQFTLYGDARKGRRPTWNAAAPGEVAEPIYDAFCDALRDLGVDVAEGVFGAQMEITLTNDGPTTLVVDL